MPIAANSEQGSGGQLRYALHSVPHFDVRLKNMPDQPKDIQLEIAAALGIDISADTERVAAARIRERVASAIQVRSYDGPATDKQIEYGEKIGLDLSADTKGIASAKIDDRHAELNRAAHERLKLKPGDEVIKTSSFETDDGTFVYETEYIVSSVGKDTKVYFKGGNGRCAWPTQLRPKLGEQD